MKTAFILSISSDIGRELAVRFLQDGWRVVGTCRSQSDVTNIPAGCRLLDCDLDSRQSIGTLIEICHREQIRWDIFIVATGTEEPIGSFLECDSDAWENGIAVNALAPLRVLRELMPLRIIPGQPAVAFFSGSGTNGAAPAYSAYCASKIFLIKMCELLDAESQDTNFFIIGPGVVRTKIHEQTVRAQGKSGGNFRRVVDFLGSENPGTSHEEIYKCLQWCVRAGKAVVGGRNISLVYDAWKDGGEALIKHLCTSPDLYKLRRFGNDLKLDT